MDNEVEPMVHDKSLADAAGCEHVAHQYMRYTINQTGNGDSVGVAAQVVGWYTGSLLTQTQRPHGYGTMVYTSADNRTYKGNWNHGLQHGQGRTDYTTPGGGDGDFDKGQYQNHFQHGPGTEQRQGRLYVGDFENGWRHGQGVVTVLANGDSYTGTFLRGDMHGYGVFRTGNGVYMGDWKHGQMHGRGTLTFKTETDQNHNQSAKASDVVDDLYCIYQGSFANGNFHGYGVLKKASGVLVDKGYWRNGTFVLRTTELPKAIALLVALVLAWCFVFYALYIIPYLSALEQAASLKSDDNDPNQQQDLYCTAAVKAVTDLQGTFLWNTMRVAFPVFWLYKPNQFEQIPMLCAAAALGDRFERLESEPSMETAYEFILPFVDAFSIMYPGMMEGTVDGGVTKSKERDRREHVCEESKRLRDELSKWKEECKTSPAHALLWSVPLDQASMFVESFQIFQKAKAGLQNMEDQRFVTLQQSWDAIKPVHEAFVFLYPHLKKLKEKNGGSFVSELISLYDESNVIYDSLASWNSSSKFHPLVWAVHADKLPKIQSSLEQYPSELANAAKHISSANITTLDVAWQHFAPFHSVMSKLVSSLQENGVELDGEWLDLWRGSSRYYDALVEWNATTVFHPILWDMDMNAIAKFTEALAVIAAVPTDKMNVGTLEESWEMFVPIHEALTFLYPHLKDRFPLDQVLEESWAFYDLITCLQYPSHPEDTSSALLNSPESIETLLLRGHPLADGPLGEEEGPVRFACLPGVLEKHPTIHSDMAGGGFLAKLSTVVKFYQTIETNITEAIELLPTAHRVAQSLVPEGGHYQVGRDFLGFANDLSGEEWKAGTLFAEYRKLVLENPEEVGPELAAELDVRGNSIPQWMKQDHVWKVWQSIRRVQQHVEAVAPGNDISNTKEGIAGTDAIIELLLNQQRNTMGQMEQMGKEMSEMNESQKDSAEVSWVWSLLIAPAVVAVVVVLAGRQTIGTRSPRSFMQQARSPSSLIDLGSLSLERRPKDVFLCFTGAQRLETVSTMKALFESSHELDCFLDKDMEHDTIGPRDTMSYHLETCRYVVVVISKEFIERDGADPRRELAFAYERMQWIREQDYFKWQSMYVVLYDLTVEKYKDARRQNNLLPDLGNEVVIEKFFGTLTPWDELCDKIKNDMLSKDKAGAVERWKVYLKGWPGNGCPRASDRRVYG